MKKVMLLDLETYSDIDITKCGAYRYVESPQFSILLFAYALQGDPVMIIDLTDTKLPQNIIDMLTDPQVIKISHNANFERICLHKFLGSRMDPAQWRCNMVKALTMGLPGSLGDIGSALQYGEDKAKMKEGKALINYFCKPCKATKTNEGRTRNLPIHAPEKWEMFKLYCKQDVEVMISIWNEFDQYITTDSEIKLWDLDQEINDRGVGVDMLFINQAIKCNEQFIKRMKNEALEITGLSNPNSPAQLKTWLGERLGHDIASLAKEDVPFLMEEAERWNDPDVVRILELRQLMAKTSIKKYETMKRAYCNDDRVHGLLQFYGANRTGRWAGRLVQVQNLPQNHIPDLNDARTLVKEGKFNALEFLFDSVPDTLSQLIRTAFIPRQGNRFIVADFSAIEARVIAWMAGESWRLEVFKTHGKIYEASAAKMFKVPIESIKKGSPLRQKGKISELALGYGGSVGALTVMGALKMGVSEDELQELVSSWRSANKMITKFWWDCDKAAKKAIEDQTTVILQHGLKFIAAPGLLMVELPSGRKLSYFKPSIQEGKFGKPVVCYMGQEQTTHRWVNLETYGPKLVENIIQAIARDCLGVAMQRVNAVGFDVVMHVHDEIICDTPIGFGSVDQICAIFAQPIPWAHDLLLKADGYECDYYRKD